MILLLLFPLYLISVLNFAFVNNNMYPNKSYILYIIIITVAYKKRNSLNVALVSQRHLYKPISDIISTIHSRLLVLSIQDEIENIKA